MTTYVRTTVTDGVATLTIDRRERHNSFVPALLEELLDEIRDVQDLSAGQDQSAGEDESAVQDQSAGQGEQTVQAIVLETAGRSFSTGGDVAAFYEHREDIASYADRTVGLLNDVILALRRAPQPVVAAVDGQVTGGAIGLLLGADIVLLTPAAEITPYYPVVGYSPDGGWTAILPDVIGPKRTAYILSTNGTITPEQAVEWGLASELVEQEQVQERAGTVARQIAAMKDGSIEQTKQLVGPSPDDVAGALDAERRAFVSQIQTDEALDGMRAFLDDE